MQQAQDRDTGNGDQQPEDVAIQQAEDQDTADDDQQPEDVAIQQAEDQATADDEKFDESDQPVNLDSLVDFYTSEDVQTPITPVS